MKKEKISVIVPVYNVEDYLEHCVNSILNQTYDNIELILVDDGSKDNSSKLCDEFAKKDKRVKSFHKKNGGQAEARNFGIKKSTSNYIVLIDSDDYINKNMIKCLYDEMKKKDADIVACDLKLTNNLDEDVDIKLNGDVREFNRIEAFYNLYSKYATRLMCPCIKIYKKEIFDKVLFPSCIMEDFAVAHDILNVINKIVLVDNPYYYYYQREGSTMHTFTSEYLNAITYLENRKKLFESIDELVLVEYTDYYICLKAAILYKDAKKYSDDKNILKKLRETIKAQAKIVSKNKNNTKFQKLVCFALRIHPWFYNPMEFINVKILGRK